MPDIPPTDDPAPRVLTLCKEKLGGSRGCWQAYLVAEDAHGMWLFTPAGSAFRASDGTTDQQVEVEGGDSPGLDSLVLVPPPEQNWLASWRVPQRDLHIAVDVCSWTRREDDVLRFQDWELDPFLLRSGVVGVEDLDDFADARAAGRLDQESAEAALAAAAWSERRLRRRSAPFDGQGDRLLAGAGLRGLAPLTRVPHPFDL